MDDVGKDGSIVEYGINGYTLKAVGSAEKFVDGGAAKRSQYIHRVSFFYWIENKSLNKYGFY